APADVAEASIGKSIAVLPFVNMSADKDNDYFSDGLSEELLNLLAKVDGLKVAARTSSFKFRNSGSDIAEIGKQLNVATVLEGSVRKSGNQARITAQLIKVDDGFHLWSETYDRELDNIFEVQDEIAQAIVDALKLPLLGHDAKPLTSTASTDNFEAYDLYLLGRHHAREYSQQGFERARDYYLKALEIDPAFAPAYGGLADAYLFLSDYGDLPQGEAHALARTAVDKALSIDPDSPEAHTSFGLLLNNLGHNHEAEAHFQKALSVNPNYVNAMLWYRNSLNRQFENNEAMEITERALALDPLSPPVRRMHVHQLIAMNRFDDAGNEIQALIAANPDDPLPYELWGDLFRDQGLPQKAIPMYRNAHRLRPGDIYMAAQNTIASLQLDDAGLVNYWLEQARSRGADGQWTRNAEIVVTYSTGDFSGLLALVEELLKSQPGRMQLLSYRSIVLMDMGELEAAIDDLVLALDASGYEASGDLSGDQVMAAVLLADVYDKAGQTEKRDRLLDKSSRLLAQLRQSEPPNRNVLFADACVASIHNDLPGVLRELAAARAQGFGNHWELLRNPVFKRWQDNSEFIAFHQDTLKAAETMRREYYLNNPVETPGPASGETN
ncbi:MAG: tetratricopeptide repeat protein, partial [Lysobacterales bacterium]